MSAADASGEQPVKLLVLASSRKIGGRCIAGWRIDDDQGWLRPVSARPDGTLELEDCAVDGAWPEIFDVVEVPLAEPRPTPWHPEDVVIAKVPWRRVAQAEPREIVGDVASLVETVAQLLRSTTRTIPAEAFRQTPLAASLVLVEPETLSWRIEKAPWGDVQRKALFTRPDTPGSFDLMVTDPAVYARLLELDEGVHDRSAVGIDPGERVFLTISVTEPWAEKDTCSKIVAAVVRCP